jgi:hypothetical protein
MLFVLVLSSAIAEWDWRRTNAAFESMESQGGDLRLGYSGCTACRRHPDRGIAMRTVRICIGYALIHLTCWILPGRLKDGFFDLMDKWGERMSRINAEREAALKKEE